MAMEREMAMAKAQAYLCSYTKDYFAEVPQPPQGQAGGPERVHTLVYWHCCKAQEANLPSQVVCLGYSMDEIDALHCSDSPVSGKDPVSLAKEEKFYPSAKHIEVVSNYMKYELADIITAHIPSLKPFRTCSSAR